MGVMDGLEGATDQQKRAALQALAAGGQRGLDAYRSGISNVDASQQQALARTQARGSYLGADAQGELSSIVGGSGDAARTALQRQMATFGADNNARSQATGAYFDQVKGAIPLAKQYGDNQINLARTQFEQERARQAAEDGRASEEHRRRMEIMNAQAAASAAKSGAGSDSYTDSQKLKIAQALAAEQERAGLQSQMDSRIEELNRQGMDYWNATKGTANERSGMGGGPGVTTTADRAERDSNTVIDARKRIGWSSGSLDLMDPGRNPQVDTTGMPGYAADQARVSARAVQERTQQEEMAAALAQLAALDQQKAPFQERIDLMDQDTKRAQAQRAQAMSLFGDPGLALLAGSYTDPETLFKQGMQNQISGNEFDNFTMTGYRNPNEQLSSMRTQQGLEDTALEQTMDPKVLTLAKQLGEDPQVVAAARQTATYRQAADLVQGLETPTKDEVRETLLIAASEPGNEGLVEIIPLVIAEMEAAGLLFGNGYLGQG